MRRLVLIKHAAPEITPRVPAAEWPLSAEGRAQCPALATRLRSFNPALMLSSVEPKALETARLVGADLGAPVEAVADLHEHDWRDVSFLPEGDFRAAVARFFARPDELVLGCETAVQALERFAPSIDDIIARRPDGDLVVVTHGTVISLFVAARTGGAPYPLWERLGLPSYAVLSLPALDLVAVVETIAVPERRVVPYDNPAEG